MAERYFKKEGVLFMVSMDTYKVYMFIGDCWVRVTDPEIRATIRFRSTEITKAATMALIVNHQKALLPQLVPAATPWTAPQLDHSDPLN